MGSKNKRFRIQPDLAIRMGLTPNKSNRYRLNEEQQELFFSLKENNTFEDILNDNKFNPQSNWEYGWMKTKEGSIFVKNPHKDEEVFNPEDFRDKLVNELKSYSPSFTAFKRPEYKEPHALVIDIADLHVGKYSSFFETGEDYDSSKAFNVAINGLEGLLAKSKGFEISEIVFVIGNDILHIDTPKRTTTSGTPQDTSGMWYENFILAKEIYVKCIEKLLPIADLHIVYCPSNHDYMSGFMLADTIYSYFRNHHNITFDIDMSHRKYYRYGDNLIGFSHGDGAKMEHAPLLMANEDPIGWSKTKYRYVYLHHIHHKEQWKFKGGKDYHGVTVEYLRSPSGTDSWHHRQGYQHNKKAVEAFIHSKSNGQVCRLTHHV